MAVNAGDPHPDSGMEDFGYRESLDRSIGKFASFAAGVSYISILTGTFQLFYFGFGTAGPAYRADAQEASSGPLAAKGSQGGWLLHDG